MHTRARVHTYAHTHTHVLLLQPCIRWLWTLAQTIATPPVRHRSSKMVSFLHQNVVTYEGKLCLFCTKMLSYMWEIVSCEENWFLYCNSLLKIWDVSPIEWCECVHDHYVCVRPPTYMHAYIHTYIRYVCLHMHVCVHKHILMALCMHTPKCTHGRPQAHTDAYTHRSTHTCTLEVEKTHRHTNTDTRVLVHVSCMYTCINRHTQIHTKLQMQIHTCIQGRTSAFKLKLPRLILIHPNSFAQGDSPTIPKLPARQRPFHTHKMRHALTWTWHMPDASKFDHSCISSSYNIVSITSRAVLET